MTFTTERQISQSIKAVGIKMGVTYGIVSESVFVRILVKDFSTEETVISLTQNRTDRIMMRMQTFSGNRGIAVIYADVWGILIFNCVSRS